MPEDVMVQLATIAANQRALERDIAALRAANDKEIERMAERVSKQEANVKMAVWAVMGIFITAVMRLVVPGIQ